MAQPGRSGEPRLGESPAHVSADQPGRAVPETLTALAGLAVAVHLFGLYRTAAPPSLSWFPSVDKLEHLIGFGAPVCLILLAGRAWQRRSGRPAVTRRFLGVVVAVFAAHGVVSELIQHYFYVTRTGDPYDTLADWVGVALGVTLARLLSSGPPCRANAELDGQGPR